MQIHQMQMSYSGEEYRIILRVGGASHEEFSLFLTRRLVNMLWRILMQTIERQSEQVANDTKLAADIPAVKEMQQEVQHQQMVEQTNYDKPFDKGQTFPIGEAPVLVSNITVNGDNTGATTFIFSNSEGVNITLNLNQQLLHNLCDLLIKIAPSTDWQLPLEGLTSTPIGQSGQAVLH